MDLNLKQQRFVSEYLIDLNATQAAIRAGYSKNSAKEQGYRMLTYVHIQEAIADANRQRADKTKITQEYVLINLMRVVERCMQVEPVVDHDGNETGVFKFNAPSGIRALELLGKHLQMFTDNGPNHSLTHEQILRQIEELSK